MSNVELIDFNCLMCMVITVGGVDYTLTLVHIIETCLTTFVL